MINQIIKQVFALFILTMLVFGSDAQSSHTLLKSADKSYEEGDYETAELNYRKSIETEYSDKGSYNLGNTVYKQQRFDEALKYYGNVIDTAAHPNIRSQAYYNLGNTFFQQEDYENAIKSYINSLKLNPSDIDSKKNLMFAKQQLKQQQEQQKQEQQEQEKQEQQEEQEEQEQQQQQQQEEQEDQNQQEQPSEQEKQEQQQQESEKNEEGQKEDLSKQEAEELLKIAEEEDKKVQKKLKKGKGQKKRPEKDW